MFVTTRLSKRDYMFDHDLLWAIKSFSAFLDTYSKKKTREELNANLYTLCCPNLAQAVKFTLL